jgi:hypothetical protein
MIVLRRVPSNRGLAAVGAIPQNFGVKVMEQRAVRCSIRSSAHCGQVHAVEAAYFRQSGDNLTYAHRMVPRAPRRRRFLCRCAHQRFVDRAHLR